MAITAGQTLLNRACHETQKLLLNIVLYDENNIQRTAKQWF